MRLADYVIERLESLEIDSAFMVTGRGALFLTDAVAKSDLIQPICMHNEQACSYAANAYAQAKNSYGLCVVSTGCASTNAITGVLTAWQDCLPVIFVSGQNTLQETQAFTKLPIRTFGQQEADIETIVTPITKFAKTVTSPSDIGKLMDEALYLANHGKKGPVWIDIPLDIQSAQIDPETLETWEPSKTIQSTNASQFAEIVAQLSTAERPIVLVGSGVRASETVQRFIEFVELNQLPVAYTGSAPDILSVSHDLCAGSVGSMGCSRSGAFAVQNSDFVLVLGNRLHSLTTGPDYCDFARDAKVVVVDIDAIEHSKVGVHIDTLIQMDLRDFFASLPREQITRNLDGWCEQISIWKNKFLNREEKPNTDGIDLYDFSAQLSDKVSEHCHIITDSGFAEVIIPTNFDFKKARRSIHPYSQGAMGYALPAILGLHAASVKDIVVIVGDGSFMMNMQELESIRNYSAKYKIFVINNNAYSIIERRQTELFRKRTVGTNSSNGVTIPDLEKLSAVFDLKYERISGCDDIENGIVNSLSYDGSVLCEVFGRLDQKYIEIAAARGKNGRFARRPLEDQWPFLNRDEFLQNMLVKTLEISEE
jgi:acetolactate synthase I/II/III large subunit